MKIIAKGRGRGKTTELLAIAQENQYAFVCCHQQEVRRLKAMQIDVPIILSFHEFKTYRLRGRALNGIVIDNADRCIFNTIWTEKWEALHTEELIKLSAKHWKYISVPYGIEFDLARKAKESGFDIPFPIVHGENCHVKPVLFHDPEFYLQAIAGSNPVKYVTVSELNTINIRQEAQLTSLFNGLVADDLT